jgi:hypothetical protein
LIDQNGLRVGRGDDQLEPGGDHIRRALVEEQRQIGFRPDVVEHNQDIVATQKLPETGSGERRLAEGGAVGIQ